MSAAGRRHWAAWPARRPWAALAIAGGMIVLSAMAILRLRPDPSLESMMSKDDPAVKAAVRVLNEFPAAEELLVLASLREDVAANPSKLLAFAQRLEQGVKASRAASALCAKVSYRADPEILEFFKDVLAPNGLYYLDRESFNAARERLTRERMLEQFRRDEAMVSAPGPVAGAMAKQFLKDPLRLIEFVMDRLVGSRPFKTYQNTDAFISADGRSILIRIAGRRPPSDLEAAKAMTSAVTEIANRANVDGLRIDVSGAYAIAAASERAIRHDMILSVFSSIAFLAGLFVLAYRRPGRLVVIGFVPVAVGVVYGFGAYGMFSTSLTPLTAVIGGILAGMGIDYTIQYVSHYQASRSLGRGPVEAAEHTARSIGAAIVAAWATSIVGFVAIGWSRVQALRDFSLLGSLGLTGAFVGSVFVLPALLAIVDRRAGSSTKAPRPRLDVAPALRWIQSRRMACVLACILVMAVSVAIVGAKGGWLGLESDLSAMHPQPNPALDAQTRIAQRMGSSPGSMIVYLKAASAEKLVELSHRVRERLATDAVRQAGVVGTYGLATLLPDPSLIQERRTAIGPGEVDRVIADFREVVSQSAFRADAFEPYVGALRHLLLESRPPTVNDLLERPELAKTVLAKDAVTATRAAAPTEAITLVFVDRPLEDAATRGRAVETIRAALVGLPGATLTGLNVISHDMSNAIQSDLPRLTIISIGVVLAYLLIQLRSIREPLLALVPMVFSLVVTLAVMHLLNQRLNMINLVTIPLLIGITVDYGVFVVNVARLAMREPPEVFERQLSSSVHAVILCAMSMILGFGSLVLTSVPAVRSLGLAVGVGVFTCVLGTLFCLIPLVVRVGTERRTAMQDALVERS